MAVPYHPPDNRRFVQEGPDVDRLTRAPLDTMPAGTFESSNVHSGLYDFGQRHLFMRYLRDGEPDAIYQYWDVPAREWDGLKVAGSKGSYVNANVAFSYEYALFGRDSFPDRSAIESDFLRRFVYDP